MLFLLLSPQPVACVDAVLDLIEQTPGERLARRTAGSEGVETLLKLLLWLLLLLLLWLTECLLLLLLSSSCCLLSFKCQLSLSFSLLSSCFGQLSFSFGLLSFISHLLSLSCLLSLSNRGLSLRRCHQRRPFLNGSIVPDEKSVGVLVSGSTLIRVNFSKLCAAGE